MSSTSISSGSRSPVSTPAATRGRPRAVASDRRRRARDVEDEPIVATCAPFGVLDGVLNPLGKHFRFADGADADVVLVDAVGVRKLVEFLTEEVEQRLVFLRRPLSKFSVENVYSVSSSTPMS